MFFCFLCAKEFRGNNKGVELNRRINELIDFEEAIKENIQNYENLLSPSSNVTCASCFNCFKSFYELISNVKKRLKNPLKNSSEEFNEIILISETNPLEINDHEIFVENILKLNDDKIQNEDPESDFDWEINEKYLNKIKTPKNDQNLNFKITENENQEVEVEKEQTLVNKNSEEFVKITNDPNLGFLIPKDSKLNLLKPNDPNLNFISPNDSHLNSQRPNDPNLNLIEPQDQKILFTISIAPSFNPQFKSQAKSQTSTYVRYLPRSKITNEILQSNRDFITIDGVEYKIPKRKLKNQKPKPSKVRHDDQNRRKHPSLDPENEKKIRDFLEVKCHICEINFESFSKVKKHFKRFHTEKAFLICCDKKFTQRSTLLNHIEWHDKSKVHRCEPCDKEYKSKACLRAHNKMCHSEVVQCICSNCGKICKNEITLRNHLRTHEIDPTRTFQCYGCKKQFKNSHVLRIHLQKAHGGPGLDREIICHICSSQVKSKHYKQHLKIHEDDREKIKCDICNRWLLKDSMIIHMKKHNDMGTTCTICGKYLKYSAYLPRHMKLTHSEVHKFKCQHCEKPFHKKTKMMEHVAAKHTREILFRCRVEGCGREFRAEGNWKVHEKKAHPEEYERIFKPFYLRDQEIN